MVGTKVKICGLSELDALEAALEAGADMVGFVFYEPSPRHVAYDQAAELAARVPAGVQKVAVTVDADDIRLNRIADAISPDFIQAHGNEPPERIRDISGWLGIPVIKAIKVKEARDIDAAAVYQDCAAMLLFDAKAPVTLKNALPGGNAIVFDWTLIGNRENAPFILSGGLTADNVADAIRITNAPIVDVSSGVESAPGKKDAQAIRRFIGVVRAFDNDHASESLPEGV